MTICHLLCTFNKRQFYILIHTCVLTSKYTYGISKTYDIKYSDASFSTRYRSIVLTWVTQLRNIWRGWTHFRRNTVQSLAKWKKNEDSTQTKCILAALVNQRLYKCPCSQIKLLFNKYPIIIKSD